MRPRSIITILSLALVLLASRVVGQVHTRSALVQCQEVSFEVSGALPGDFVLLAYSLDGVGTGPCIPPPIDLCLDLLGNLRFLPLLVADASGQVQRLAMVPPDMALIPVASQAYIVTVLPSGEVLFGKTNPIESEVLPVGSMSDGFDGAGLDASWNVHNEAMLSESVVGGELGMQLTSNATWFFDREGPMIYKSVTGDFSVTALVRARDSQDPNLPPPLNYSLGGLIVRDPSSVAGTRNWMHLVVGAGNAQNPVVVEDKTTVNSVSQFTVRDIPSADGYLRIDRSGTLFSMYYRRESSASWELIREYDRLDMPTTVQVGLSIYGHTRIRLTVDSICFTK